MHAPPDHVYVSPPPAWVSAGLVAHSPSAVDARSNVVVGCEVSPSCIHKKKLSFIAQKLHLYVGILVYLKSVGLLIRHGTLAYGFALRRAVSAFYIGSTIPERMPKKVIYIITIYAYFQFPNCTLAVT